MTGSRMSICSWRVCLYIGLFLFLPLCVFIQAQEFYLEEFFATGSQTSLKWLGPNELYAGQSVLYSLVLEKHAMLEFPENIDIGIPADSIFEEVYGVGEIKENNDPGGISYSIPIAAFLLTPGREGALTFPLSEVTLGENTYRSVEKTVLVRSLPREVHGIGSLGFSYVIDKTRIKPGETATITVTFSGEGNIPFINYPGPTSSLATIALLDDRHDAETSVLGYQGNRIIQYEVSSRSADAYTIELPNFIVFDSMTGEYVQQQGGEILFQVQKDVEDIQLVFGGEFSDSDVAAVRPFRDLMYQPSIILLCLFLPLGIGVSVTIIILDRNSREK